MRITKQYLLIAIFGCTLLANNRVNAQEKTERKQTFPVAVSLTNHSWAFPFKKVFRVAPIYPGVAAETEFYYKSGPAFKGYQTGQIGGFINSSSGSALYLNSNLGIRYTMKFGLMADLSLGLGYFYGFYTSDTYIQNSAGEYEKSKRAGVGAMSGNMSIGLGYDFSKKTDKNITAFAKYQWISSTNYWSLITIRPNGLLHLGARFYPFQ